MLLRSGRQLPAYGVPLSFVSSEIDAVEREDTNGSRAKQRRNNPRSDTMDKDQLRDKRKEEMAKMTLKKKEDAVMKRRMASMGEGGGKLTVKAKKKKLFKKTKKKKLKKGKLRNISKLENITKARTQKIWKKYLKI